jgi:hypothetical protein
MKKIITKPCLILAAIFAIGNINATAQEQPDLVKTQDVQTVRNFEESVHPNDLIKYATKAPFSSNFSSEQEYFEAKKAWTKEYPDAYARISGKSSATALREANEAREADSDRIESIPKHLAPPNERDTSIPHEKSGE